MQIVVVHVQKIMMIAAGSEYQFEPIDILREDLEQGLDGFHENHVEMLTQPTQESAELVRLSSIWECRDQYCRFHQDD